MNYYGAKDLAESFRTVRKNTIQIAEDIPEGKYSFRAANDVRTFEKPLRHDRFGKRTRDASSRPAHADRTHDRHCSAPDAPDAGADGAGAGAGTGTAEKLIAETFPSSARRGMIPRTPNAIGSNS